jgi:hypothetical protein
MEPEGELKEIRRQKPTFQKLILYRYIYMIPAIQEVAVAELTKAIQDLVCPSSQNAPARHKSA